MHSRALQYKSIDPAAHLDTVGYDLYDKVGLSLGMTNAHLHISSEELADKKSGETLLSRARRLASDHFLSGNARVESIINTYTKAIDLLIMERNIYLAVDGMHDLGNLLYFTGQLK